MIQTHFGEVSHEIKISFVLEDLLLNSIMQMDVGHIWSKWVQLVLGASFVTWASLALSDSLAGCTVLTMFLRTTACFSMGSAQGKHSPGTDNSVASWPRHTRHHFRTQAHRTKSSSVQLYTHTSQLCNQNLKYTSRLPRTVNQAWDYQMCLDAHWSLGSQTSLVQCHIDRCWI